MAIRVKRLVCAEVYRVDAVKIQRCSGINGIEGLGKVTFPETSEFLIVALWTLEVEPVFSLFAFFVAPDPVAAPRAGALVNVRLLVESFVMDCFSGNSPCGGFLVSRC